jgi:DNA-binding phage protein
MESVHKWAFWENDIYLDIRAAIKTGDPAVIAKALDTIVHARAMAQVAKKRRCLGIWNNP